MDKDETENFSDSTSRKWSLIGVACGLLVFAACAALGYSSKAGFAGVFVAALVWSVCSRWTLRGRPWFWVLIFALSLAHGAIIYLVPPNWRYPGAILMPVALADLLFFGLVMGFAAKIFRPSNPR
jgi:hypothetical protein